jgi:predicted nucleic-acid-binding Zn-ribbon protein
MADQRTNRIDHDDPRANMFGILPCPKCGNTHRWPTQPVHPKHPNCILCDACGFVEPYDPKELNGER